MPWTVIDERQLEKRAVVAMGRAERAIAEREVVVFKYTSGA
jgi:hypothetical protein